MNYYLFKLVLVSFHIAGVILSLRLPPPFDFIAVTVNLALLLQLARVTFRHIAQSNPLVKQNPKV
jgi:hypothetical protein